MVRSRAQLADFGTQFGVVVRFSKSRGRYERQGLLLEPQALAGVQRNLAQQGVMSVGKGKTDA